MNVTTVTNPGEGDLGSLEKNNLKSYHPSVYTVYPGEWFAVRVYTFIFSIYKHSKPFTWIRIVKVYAPSWFQIKAHSCFTADPSNLFLQMRLIVRMPVETQNTVIQRNAYFAHPSVLLCAMLASDNDIPWRKAVSIIRKSRNDPPKPPRSKILMNMRIYIIPPLQWNANEWWEMVDWKSLKVHLPAILSTLSEEELDSALTTYKFPAFPCHSQTVERAVKLVTEASSKVCGGEI